MQRAMQMQSGELDLALLTPKDAQMFADQEGYTCYDMKTPITVEFCLILQMNTGRKIRTSFLQYATVLTGKQSFSLCCLDRV